ncbi:hypothetical protein HK099_008150 [Clydaea vesicula]|uniref:Uncharacterized protein n=1 Tax=Clydaea vesicula TaxID=447962 RepID=A0AAD5TY59_9FUNG|nr:hypothetical protein HK099_008150 [Clydaea vesicula]
MSIPGVFQTDFSFDFEDLTTTTSKRSKSSTVTSTDDTSLSDEISETLQSTSLIPTSITSQPVISTSSLINSFPSSTLQLPNTQTTQLSSTENEGKLFGLYFSTVILIFGICVFILCIILATIIFLIFKRKRKLNKGRKGIVGIPQHSKYNGKKRNLSQRTMRYAKRTILGRTSMYSLSPSTGEAVSNTYDDRFDEEKLSSYGLSENSAGNSTYAPPLQRNAKTNLQDITYDENTTENTYSVQNDSINVSP